MPLICDPLHFVPEIAIFPSFLPLILAWLSSKKNVINATISQLKIVFMTPLLQSFMIALALFASSSSVFLLFSTGNLWFWGQIGISFPKK
jgi:hypothetical protein